jgi:hypothetical protein
VQVAKRLLEEVQRDTSEDWSEFQTQVSRLKLKRFAVGKELSESEALLSGWAAIEELSTSESEGDRSGHEGGDSERSAALAAMSTTSVRIVMITGIESFNQRLYRTVAQKVPSHFPSVV